MYVYTRVLLGNAGEARVTHTFLVLQATTSEIDHLDGTFRRVFKQHVLHKINTGIWWGKGTQYLWFQITMNDAMVPHQGQWHQHLARETAYEACCETNKTVCLDELVEVNAQKFHGNAKVASEVEVFRHLDDVVLLIRVLWNFVSKRKV
jgi:hypothetical protein